MEQTQPQQTQQIRPIGSVRTGTNRTVRVIGVVVALVVLAVVIYQFIPKEQEPAEVPAGVVNLQTEKYLTEYSSLSDEDFRDIILEERDPIVIIDADPEKIAEAVKTLQEESGLSDEDAEYFAQAVLLTAARYPTYSDEDIGEILTLDILTFETKMESVDEVSLPSEYIENMIPPLEINRFDFASGESLADLQDELGGLSYASEDDEKYLKGQAGVLGIPDKVMLNLSPFMHHGYLDLSIDGILYDPEGKIIPELSRKNVTTVKEDNIAFSKRDTWVSLQSVQIPLGFDPGRYVLEMTVHDRIEKTFTVLRYPLDMVRRLTFTDVQLFDFNKILDAGYSADQLAFKKFNMSYTKTDIIIISAWVLGFKDSIPANQLDAVHEDVKITLFDGTVVTDMPKKITFSEAIDHRKATEILTVVELDGTLDVGDYLLRATLVDEINSEEAVLEVPFSIIGG